MRNTVLLIQLVHHLKGHRFLQIATTQRILASYNHVEEYLLLEILQGWQTNLTIVSNTHSILKNTLVDCWNIYCNTIPKELYKRESGTNDEWARFYVTYARLFHNVSYVKTGKTTALKNIWYKHILLTRGLQPYHLCMILNILFFLEKLCWHNCHNKAPNIKLVKYIISKKVKKIFVTYS